jgi:hypothetical protein
MSVTSSAVFKRYASLTPAFCSWNSITGSRCRSYAAALWYRDREHAVSYAEWVSQELDRAEILIHNMDGMLADRQLSTQTSSPLRKLEKLPWTLHWEPFRIYLIGQSRIEKGKFWIRKEPPMQFVILARHSPEHCPTSNAKIRQLMKEGAKEIPQVAKKLGVKIITINVYGPDHEVLVVAEADGIEPVRDFVMQSRLVQWNTTTIHATWSLEEALAKAEALPTIF